MIEIELGIQHHFSSGVYAKQMHLPAAHYAETHEHTYDHMSILASGHVIVTIDGEVTEYIGPAVVHVAKGRRHRIEALSDSVWFCIHATDETDTARIDSALIQER